MAALTVGDIIAVAKFFNNTYDNIQNADTEFTLFKNAAKDLASSLKYLADALEEQQRIIENRGATPHAHRCNVMTDLRNIIGDFSLMRQETDAFLKKHNLQKNGSRIISRRMVYKATGSMKTDLRELRCALLLHLARVQIASQTLQAKAQSGIARRHDESNKELMQKFDDHMKTFSSLLSMLSGSNSGATACDVIDGGQLVLTSPNAQDINSREREIDQEFAWLESKFVQNLPLLDQSQSMPKMVDVCIWWYLKGKDWTLKPPEAETDLQRYIDLSKSYWLLRQVMGLPEFGNLRKHSYSMWAQYVGNLSEKLANEFAAMRGLRLPSLNELKRFAEENPSCFDLGFNTSWNGLRSQSLGSSANDRRIAVLSLNLPGYPVEETDRKVTVLLQDLTNTDALTVEDVQTTKEGSFINASSHVPANHREVFSINRNDAQLIPCYAWSSVNQSPTIKLHPGDRVKPIGFEFSSMKDMFNFQKTFTSFVVKSDIPRVESLRLKTGFFGETHYKTARVQIWFEDLGAEGQGDASGPTSPTLSDDHSSFTTPSSGLTSTSKASNWSHSSTIMPAQCIQKIESSQVVLYTTDDDGERQLIFFISLDQCKLDHDSCCGRSRNLSSRSQQDLTVVTCCDRAVLVAPSKYLMLERLTQKHDRTPLAIPLRQNFLKHDRIAKDTPRPGVKHVPVKWLAIKFKDMNDKGNFVKNFEQLKKLKNIKVGKQNEMLKQARQLEMK